MKLKNNYFLFEAIGIPVQLNISWFIILALITYGLAFEYFPSRINGINPILSVILGLITALLLFGSLLLHELSHAYVAEKNGLPVRSITLFIFGGVAALSKEPESPKVELQMALAGPAMSFALAFACWILYLIIINFIYIPWILAILAYIFYVNLVVGVFNLIPGFPLDGGRVLRALTWHYNRDYRKATFYATAIGKGIAFLLMGLGAIQIFTGDWFSGLWLILIGYFLEEAAKTSYLEINNSVQDN